MKTPNIQKWSIDQLKPYENNSKKHPKEQVAKIAASIKQFNWTQPIVVDKDGVIIAGHGRRLAAIYLGLTEVPVWVRDDLAPDEVRALRLADNRVGMSDIDPELFRAELQTLDFDLGTFFDAKELEFSVADLGEMVTGAFVADIDTAVTEQEAETKQKIEALAEKPIALTKALGFKEIPGNAALDVSRFMAEIERRTAKKGVEAFVAFARVVWAAPVGEGA